ncbi:MAG: aminopeptidase N [Kordiimonadaceae bacterium]|jgi:aminopeptidase N|nr:aminopeptidase N [Kordiimonadaceae bacterium]MBT7581950.1 aminopeptidase N [Kordiimonadaceae bacterium]
MANAEAQLSAPNTKYLADYKKPDFAIETVELNFDLHDGVTHVTSTLKIKRQGEEHAPLILNGENMTLVSIAVDGSPAEYNLDDETLTLNDVPDQFELLIKNDIDPASNTALEGLYVSNGMYCTQCEAQGFRHITYFPDRPDVMATFKVRIEADKGNYTVLLSNGNQVEAGDCAGDRHYVTWDDPFPKPSYLFALVAGDLACLEDHFTTRSGTKVTLRIFAESKDLEKCTHAMLSLKKSMKWDEDVYGLEYDLDIFNIVAVSHFNMGAMENKSLNVFNTKCVLAKPETATDTDFSFIEAVVAHEYFHNWTGNRVTCRDWFQLSLKEGLTVFRDHEFSADMGSRAVTRISDVRTLRQHQFAEDSGPMAHSVRPESYIEINNFYTMTVYEKGSEVIRMMHTLLGPQKYRKAMDLYFERHDGQAVTCEDFVCAMEDGSGVDLSQFRLWYSQAGTPELTVLGNYDEQTQKYNLTITQVVPDTPGQTNKKPMHIPIEMGLLDSDGNEMLPGGTILLDLKEARQVFQFENISEKPVPSILRGFSAPVKIRNSFDRADQIFLIGHDSDSFNRWEAAQVISTDIILTLVEDLKTRKTFKLDDDYINAIGKVLNDKTLDKAFIGEMLALPSEGILGQEMSPIDVDAIHKARKMVVQGLATSLKSDLLRVYKECNTNEVYRFSPLAVGRRRLKNMVLGYLMEIADEEILNLCSQQYYFATNMTDEIAAFTFMVDSDAPGREVAIDNFYDKWQDDELVIDKWFSAQALSTRSEVIDRIEVLNKHADFDLKTPNRVRSLISVFCGLNQVSFHDKSGRGYEFLARNIKELDPINPQIAAGLAKQLTRWKAFDADRQKMMVSTLEDILKQDGLSKHVYEIVSKSLI